MIDILINGEKKSIPEHSAISKIIAQHNLTPDHIVIELNEEILDRSVFSTTILKAKDSLEIIQFVPGG